MMSGPRVSFSVHFNLHVLVTLAIRFILYRLSHTDDFRIFVGNLGNEVNEALLIRTFSHYPSFAMVSIHHPSQHTCTLDVSTYLSLLS